MNDQLESEIEAALGRLATQAVPDAQNPPAPPWAVRTRRFDVRRFGRATPWLVAAVLLVIAGLGIGAAVTFDAGSPDRGPVGTDGPNPGPVVSPDSSDTPTTVPTASRSHPPLSRDTNGSAPDDSETTTTSATTSGSVTDARIGVYANCNEPTNDPASIRPTSIGLACADNGENLLDLTWTSWTSTAATGTGTLEYRTCEPDCASGTQVHTQPGVTVTLSAPRDLTGGARIWTQLDVTPDPAGSGSYPLPTVP